MHGSLSGFSHRCRPVLGCFFFLLLFCCVVCSAGATPYTAADCNCGGVGLPPDGSWPVNVPENGYYALTCQYGGYANIPYAGKGRGVEFEIHTEKPAVAGSEFQGRLKAFPQTAPKTPDLLEFDLSDPNRAVYSFKQKEGSKVRYSGTRVLVYKNKSYIFVYGLGYDAGDSQFLSMLNAAESCAKAVADAGEPSPRKKMIKGTITGKGFTREIYQEIQEAVDEVAFHDNDEKANALLARLKTGSVMAKPLRHVKIIWKGSQEAGAQDKEIVTSTDENGNFEIPATPEPGKQYQFDIEFSYRKGDKDYFSISEATAYNVATYPHTFDFAGDRDLRQDVNFITDLDQMKEDEAYVAGITSTLMLYDETANALEFYQDHLGETLDCNLPLSVYPFWPDRRSKFEIDSGRGNGTPSPAIIIKPDDSTFDNPFHSTYVVYHEFSHYAMYCIYGKKFPASPADSSGPVKTINHGGYMNPSTSDSFTEGFADFMPAVMEEYYGNPSTGTSGSMGSIEDMLRAWEYEGKAEEYAVSTTLWSLYNTDKHYETDRKYEEKIRRDILADPAKIAFEANLAHMTADEYRAQVTRELGLLQSGKNLRDDEHPVKLTFNEIWPVLRTYNRDFTDVYNGFISRYPGRKAAIDSVFAAHGFYRSTVRGNGSYDPGEPWRAATGDRKTFAPGDPFIDYPLGGFSYYKVTEPYTGNSAVGSASEYNRTTRRSSEPLPGHFIRTQADVPLYVVSVEYFDHPWMNYRTLVSSENRMVPVPVPPPGYDAGVTVVPVGVKSDNPLYFRSEEFNRNFPAAAARGYYLEHDFKVSGPIPARTTVRTGDGGSLSSLGKGGSFNIFTSRGPAFMALEQARGGNFRSLWILLVPVGMLALLVFLFWKKK